MIDLIDKIAIIVTVLSIVSIVFAIMSLIDLNRDSVDISFDKHFFIEFKDGSRLDMKNGLNEFGEAEKISDESKPQITNYLGFR